MRDVHTYAQRDSETGRDRQWQRQRQVETERKRERGTSDKESEKYITFNYIHTRTC